MLRIHSNITDNEALQGYEGLPLQLERIMWEVYGILAKNPNIKTPEEIRVNNLKKTLRGKPSEFFEKAVPKRTYDFEGIYGNELLNNFRIFFALRKKCDMQKNKKCSKKGFHYKYCPES